VIFWINSFPFPPSINRSLASFRGRHIKTRPARAFDVKVQTLKQIRAAEWIKIKEAFEPKLTDHVIKVDQYFVFHKPRIFTSYPKAKAWVQTLDHLNFNKASEDALAKCLEIDDKFFFSGHKEKVCCETLAEEQIIFRLELIQPRSLTDIRKLQEMDRLQ